MRSEFDDENERGAMCIVERQLCKYFEIPPRAVGKHALYGLAYVRL
jgi:hypothetical protein